MEYRIESLMTELALQRRTLVKALSKLNENLPNYSLKCSELNNQIQNIDYQNKDYILALKDIEMQELANKLTIETHNK